MSAASGRVGVGDRPRDVAGLARSGLLLLLVGSSCGMFLALLGVLAFGPSELSDIVRSNRWHPGERRGVLLGVLAGALAALVSFAVTVARSGRLASAVLDRRAARLGPLAVLGPLPVLVQPSVWFHEPLPFLLALAGLALCLEKLLFRWAKWNVRQGAPWLSLWLSPERAGGWKRHLPLAVVLCGALAYGAYTLYFSVQQHQRLATSAFDLGIYDNLLYNALHGHPFRSPVLFGPQGGNYLAGHAEFIMLAFVPLYALWPGPYFLLTLQASLLAVAALPLYGVGAKLIGCWGGCVLALCYLLYAPLHGSAFYDFHWLPLTIFFNFCLQWAIVVRKNGLAALCFLALLSIREDVSVGLFFFGFAMLLAGYRVRLALCMSAVSVAWFVAVRFAIMPLAGPFHFPSMIYGALIAPGEAGFVSVVKTLLVNPVYFLRTLVTQDKLTYALHIMAPVVFLPWRTLATTVFCAGGFFFTLMTTNYPPTLSLAFQYPSHWIPYVFGAVAVLLRRMARGPEGIQRRGAALATLVFAVVLHSFVFGALLQRKHFVGGFFPVAFAMSESEQQRYSDLQALRKHIPGDATVSATERLVPHVSTRVTVYTLRIHHGGARYILVDRRELDTHQRVLLAELARSGDYRLIESRGELYLFGRGERGKAAWPAFQELGVER